MTKLDRIIAAFLGFSEQGLNVLSYLAQHGKKDAVEDLLLRGGKEEDAVYGYALAGEVEQVNAFIKSSAEPERDLCIKSAIRGYARRGDEANIQAIDGYRRYQSERLLGLAQAGNKEAILPILNKDRSLLYVVVEGYASGNHAHLLIELIENTGFYSDAIYHAARSGHRELVNQLLEHSLKADFSRSEKLRNRAAQGYLAGSHFADAARMVEHGASLKACFSELNALRNSSNFEPYFAFLAHMDSLEGRQEGYKQLYELAESLSGELSMGLSKITKIEEKTAKMASTGLNYIGLNYIETEQMVKNSQGELVNSQDGANKGNITLAYLAKVIENELTLKVSADEEEGMSISFSYHR
ncbi:MAG: hypothetical protein JJT82_09610 [Legionellaceae bacterium]|nr:hypothetical protein [Legionellaceae bacterium]